MTNLIKTRLLAVATALLTTLAGSGALSQSAPIEMSRPTNSKVRDLFTAWETYLGPYLCYPDSQTYKVTIPANKKLEGLILEVAQHAAGVVITIEALVPLTTEADVRKAAADFVDESGVKADSNFADLLDRVFQKAETRLVFKATTESPTGQEGQFIAVVDLEYSEITVLTDGPAFNASRCEGEEQF